MDPSSPTPQPASRADGPRPLKPARRSPVVNATDDEEDWLVIDDLEDHSDDEMVPAPHANAPARTCTARLKAALAKDISLHSQMQLEATLGRTTTWQTEVRDDLFQYAYGVLPKKIVSGEIFRMMSKVRAPRAADLAMPTSGPAMTDEEAQDLATDATVWALERFHQVLLQDWSPDHEATFRTYFIGKCCHGFVGVYRKWLGERRRRSHASIEELPEEQMPAARDKPHVAAIVRVEFEQVLESADDDLEYGIAVAKALEVPSNVIARMFDVSEKKVEYRLKKLRSRAA